MDEFHTSVLQTEVATFLDVQEGKKYIDATLGGGGHTFEILKKGGRVLGIDVDEEAIDYVKFRIQNSEFRIGQDVILARGNFKHIGEIARAHGFERVDGVLFDLGVSSYQLDTQERGFSFQNSGPLDMRMNKDLSVTAADLVNGLTKKELYELLCAYGEERNAWSFSECIVAARKVEKITTTDQLARILKEKVRGNFTNIHPATRVFQALRIAVNDELHSIENALPQALELLDGKGRIVVMSFHSLEDKIVKHAFALFAKEKKGIILTEKPVVPTEEEVAQNNRSRSAKLRVFEKIYEKKTTYSYNNYWGSSCAFYDSGYSFK